MLIRIAISAKLIRIRSVVGFTRRACLETRDVEPPAPELEKLED